MNQTSPAPSRAALRPRGPLAAAALVALVLAFTGGLWFSALLTGPVTAGAPAPLAPLAAEAPSDHPGDPLAAGWDAPAAPPAPGVADAASAAAQAPLLTPQGRPTAALVSRVTEEAARSFEAARAGLTARCVPESRRAAPGGRFTFNVVFDAAGREIARGIAEDRRQRAPEVASCLRALPLGAIQVTPPGTRVGVRVAMSLP